MLLRRRPLDPPPSFRHRLRTGFLSFFGKSLIWEKVEKRKRHFYPPLFSSFLPSGWGRPHKSMFLPSLPPPPRVRRGGNSQFHGITFCCTVCGEKRKRGEEAGPRFFPGNRARRPNTHTQDGNGKKWRFSFSFFPSCAYERSVLYGAPPGRKGGGAWEEGGNDCIVKEKRGRDWN